MQNELHYARMRSINLFTEFSETRKFSELKSVPVVVNGIPTLSVFRRLAGSLVVALLLMPLPSRTIQHNTTLLNCHECDVVRN